MAFFTIPDNPLFNTAQVTRTEQTQAVINDHLNGYMQTLLENDQYVKETEEQHYTETLNNFETVNAELSKKLDGEGTVTDYDEAITITETGKVPDCTIIGRLYRNFLAGCSRIARAITGGRDGEGTGGVATADTADPTLMSTNIRVMALKNYNDGLNAATGTVPAVSHVWNPANPSAGSDASLQAKVVSEGYVATGSVLASTEAIVNSTAIAVSGGTGNETLDVPLGVYKKIKVDRSAAYLKGVSDTKSSAPTVTHVWNPANPSAGDTASLQAKSSTAGYVNANTVLATMAAGTNSTAIETTAGDGVETLNITPGVYNKIKVDRSKAYAKGVSDTKATAPTYTSSFSSSTAGADSNFVVKTSTAGYTNANVTSLTKAAGTNSTAIATGTTRKTDEVVKITPGIYNNIKINNSGTYDAGVNSVKNGTQAAFTAQKSSETAGNTSAKLQLKVTTAGYAVKDRVIDVYTCGTASVATTAGTGEETLNVTPGAYAKVTVNRSNAYAAGQANVRATAPTFSSAFDSLTAGSASNLIFTTTSSGAGYLANSSTVTTLKKAAQTNGTAIATGGTKNSAEIVNIVPGVYNKIKIDNRATYEAGVSYADGRVDTNSASYKKANATASEIVLNVSGTHYSGNAQSQRPGTEKVRDDYEFTKAYKYVVVLRDSALSQNGRVSISNATLLKQHRNSTPSGGFADCGVSIYKDVKVGSVMVCQSDDWNYNVDTQKWWMNWSVSIHGMN